MLFGMTFSPNHDNTHHYQVLMKAVVFTVPATSTSTILMSPIAAVTAGVRDHCCLHHFLPFIYKPTDPEEAFGR